jgi:delta 1-pyrroline-5-carboxylate dehydrogenase
MTYSDVSLMIDGAWTKGANGRTIPVINPATEEVIGQVAHAEKSDLDRALDRGEVLRITRMKSPHRAGRRVITRRCDREERAIERARHIDRVEECLQFVGDRAETRFRRTL